MKILFCDASKYTQSFFRRHKLAHGVETVMLASSLNDVAEADLNKYTDAEAISTFVYSRLTADLLGKFKKLKLVSTRSTGYNNVDVEYCKAHKIKVANVVGYGEITVAEFAFGLLLDIARKIHFSNLKLRRGFVNVAEDEGVDIYGKTIGVIGTGAIGRHFAKLAKGFGARALAYDIYPNKELEEAGIVKYVPLDKLIKESDMISLHCPATPENHHLVNAKSLAKMKRGVIIINTARGELVDTADLYDALVSGQVGGAGLDVLDYEDVILKGNLEAARKADKEYNFYSLVNQRLIQFPNVVLTPHIAFNSREADERIHLSAFATLKAFVERKDFKTVA
ncbi:MAG: hydroxyacid dehydrogenase [Rickettsiales bacterium]|jgi:D-lactate dehydrogenase|nr:hydroxyacid dehydrogenase [Rickettsiales bacterium]